MTAINWLGATAVVAGHFILTSPRLTGTWKITAIIIATCGSVLVATWAISVQAWPILMLQVVYSTISTIQLARNLRARSRKRA